MGNIRKLLIIVFQSLGCDVLLSIGLDFLERFELIILNLRERPYFVVADGGEYLDPAISYRFDSPVKVSPVLRVKASEYKVTGYDQERRVLICNLIDDLLASFGVGYDLPIGFMF